MKSKFSYPRIDPAPSNIVDNWIDDQKMASILRCCSQILNKDELNCWNELTERYLENAIRYESSIPKIKADLQKEITNYRTSEQEKQKLTNELNKIYFKDFTNYKP